MSETEILRPKVTAPINDTPLREHSLYYSFWKDDTFFAVWYNNPGWNVYEMVWDGKKSIIIGKYCN